jgi:hypothetical protein
MVSAIVTHENAEQLSARLAAWCVVEADDQRFNFRFPDTRRLPGIFGALTPQQRAAFAGSAISWEFIGRNGHWESLPIEINPHSVQPLSQVRLDERQFAQLVAHSEADEIWVQLLDRGIESGLLPSQRHALLTSALHIAHQVEGDVAMKLAWCASCLADSEVSDIEILQTRFAQWIQKRRGMKMNRYFVLCSTLIVLLAGCSKPLETLASTGKNTVSVNVHGVNYTADPFSYVIIDERDPSNHAGGEHVGPFQGGGIRCCFKLPKQWTPGLRVNVRATHWLKEDARGNLPEVTKVHTVEIVQYPGGKAGELWVLRTADGGIEVVMSDVEPGHPEWPGKVKGWPEPSLAYQRKQWQIEYDIAKYTVSSYKDGLKQLHEKQGSLLADTWRSDKERDPESIKGFKGPDDVNFKEYLTKKYVDGLRSAEAEVEQLLREKP